MRWHESERPKNEGVLRHPADGESWKDFDKKYPDFAQEPRNVRLGLATDGFNPYGNMSNSYSMWPVIMVPYNFPPWRCMKETNMIMSLLIPGPKAPGKDFDVFLRPLVDELKMLWEVGVDTYDAYTKSMFRMRAAITSSSHDYPAFQYISGWSTKGYKACYTCNEETPSMKIRSKIAYVGHRRFLPINETALRKSRQFNGEPDYREPPLQYTGEIILRQLEKLPEKISGKHKNFGGKKVARSPTELNWSKKSILYELPYWYNVLCRHNLDVMHIEKNVCDSLLGTLLSIDGKSKDTTKARLDLEDLNIRKELHIFKDGNRWKKPQASYTLSSEERKIFVNFIRSVRFPDNFAANLSKNVSESDGKIHGLKSHDCHIIIQRLLPAAIRPFLNKETREALFDLSKFFQQICARKLVVKDLEVLQHQVVLLLCKLERIFPPAFFDIMVHLMLHLPREALLGGPVHTRWMYPFERMMKVYKQYVRNRARPEGSIAEGYIVNEALTFCSMYLKGIESKFCRPERHQDTGGNEPARQLSVFQRVGRPLGKKNVIMLDSELRLKAEWYVLNNSGPQMQKYLDEHMNLLRAKGGTNLDRKQEIEFPLWFRDKIGNLRSIRSSEATDELYALASRTLVNAYSYPGYIVNGVKFLTHERDIRRKTQNSGVYVEGPDGSKFYGVLEEVIELSYLFNNSVILFKCKWYDTNPRRKRIQEDSNFTSVFIGGQWYQNDPYILASQAQQVFYIQDLIKGPDWRLVQKVNHRNLWDNPQAEVSSSTATDTEHVLQANNSSEFRLWVELPPLDNSTLNRHDVQPEIVENMEDFLREPILVQDDNFINDDEDEIDETLEEYDDDQSESSNKEDDSLSEDSTSDDIFSEDESH